MHPLVQKLVRALREGEVGPLTLARRVGTNVRALACGRAYLRTFNRVGARARCFGRPLVKNRGRIVAGDDFAIGSAFGAACLETGPQGRIAIGDAVTINYGTAISATEEVRFGDRVMVGPFCVIADTELPAPLATRTDRPNRIEIGDDVWLAARVVVRPGARIGAGAVIAAGSVVEGDIPANAVASGAPARVLRIRGGAAQAQAPSPVASPASSPPPPVSGPVPRVAEPDAERKRAKSA